MKRLVSALLLAVLVVTPVLVFAQDGDEWKEFVSEDELLTVVYPAEWVILANTIEDMTFPGALFANHEDALARWQEGEDVVSGDAVILIMLLPTDILAMLGIQVPAEPTILDYASGLSDSIVQEADEDNPIEASEPEEITVGEGDEARTLAYVEITEATTEGSFLISEVADNLLAVTMTYAFPGEYTDELAETAGFVAGSLAYEGTAEDVMATLMGESADSALDGETLVSMQCTTCHSAERIDAEMAAGADRAKWESIVDRMISYGAELSDDEREAVVSYLAGE